MRRFFYAHAGTPAFKTGQQERNHMATKASQAQDDQDFQAGFNEDTAPAVQKSEDEEFGLTPEAEPEPEGAKTEPAVEDPATAAAPAAAPAAELAATPAEGDGAMTEQQLKSWEGRIKAKEKELDAREAAMTTSNVGEDQSGSDEGSMGAEAGETPATEAQEQSDPAKALEDDFGADFVATLRAFIQKESGGSKTDDGLASTVDALINELREEKQSNHFQSIADAHADFMDVVETPEFSAWKESQSDKDRLSQVVESGSAKEIIAMLTAFKSSQEQAGGGDDSSHDSAIDDAEGVRSHGGLKLPSAPKDSQEFQAAWDQF
jgi:hypothetical protein